MEIRLNKLALSNFMGTREFTLEPNGKNCIVRGQNGAGKTTLATAFHWLLYNKTMDNKAEFALKTLDADGQEIHNLNHSVEAELSIDGLPITLKKVFKEKWTKKRGAARAEFTGHETQYFVSGVPVKESEWKFRIAGIINEDTFKLLTSPSYFCSLHWQKRREILLQVCGDVSDRDVIASDRDLAMLPEILGDRSLEDHRKVVAAKKKEINDRLKEIPARIDELQKSIVDVSGYDAFAIRGRIEHLSDQIQAAKDDTGAATLRKQKAELQARQAEIQGKLDGLKREAERSTSKPIEDIEAELRLANRELQSVLSDILSLAPALSFNEREMERLRAEFVAVSAQEYAGPGVCKSCGQSLPEGQIQAAEYKHNTDKAARLELINSQGKRFKKANDEKREYGSRLEKQKASLEGSIKDLSANLQIARDQKPITLAGVGKLEIRAIDDLKVEISAIDARIALRAPINTAPFEAERSEEQGKLAAIESSKRIAERIKVLTAEEKDLAAKYEDLERQTFLMERFIVTKVNLLEEKINSRFSLVRWKLFEIQINQAVSECCEATIEGVPFSSANTGSQILAGLDIISTLSKHYGVSACLWLDHRESLTSDPHMDCQMISLVAVENIKTLEVEYHE